MSESLDTNVLVRLAARDDAAQFKKAEKLVRDNFSQSVPAWISVIVIVEYTWVLTRLYQYTRKEIATTLTALLQVDCLIIVRNQANDAETTHTFDRKAAKLAGFKLIV